MFKYRNVHGLTGSIACGKTTVAKFFEKYGIKVLDLDQVSRKVVEKGSEGLSAVIREFGREYLNAKGELNRKKLGKLIFNNKNAKKKLEKILHPLIFQWEKNFIERYREIDSENPIIVDAALMIESGSYTRYEKIIVVHVPLNIQKQRLMTRENISENDADRIIKSQMPVEEKIKFADFIIDNSKNLSFTEEQVIKIARELQCC